MRLDRATPPLTAAESRSMSAPETRPLGEALGTEVLGISLSDPLDQATLGWIERTFAQHPVLVFRNQRLDAPMLDAFARRFGTPQRHVLERYRHPEIPEISYVTNVDKDGNIDPFGVERATIWHTDATYEPKLPRLAILYALEVPSERGGTVFADMRAAYDGLGPDLRERLDGLTGLHRFNVGPANSGGIYAAQVEGQTFEDQHHPAVIVHPASGRRILFVNPAHTHGFVGLDRDEGWKLVEDLSAHAVQEKYLYYHSWRVGDLVIWDELATMHRGAGDYRPQEHRVMMRSIVYPRA